ncbi:MAG: NADP-dependent isocitrate dehydrogenase [Phycisphaerales bacterium]|nr:NADP-dependent isocitrate dehydrogenase [Phycisphaerales bacterium]
MTTAAPRQASGGASAPGARHAVTLIAGDGIGPEVAQATKAILEAAGARIDWEDAVAGKEAFDKGIGNGVAPETLESLARTRVALKGPLETPVGHGGKSANVTLRKLFEMYGNIRPCKELPNVQGPFAGRGIDLIVVRENVEDVYAGIEHMQTPGVAQCLKLISQKGCEKIVRLTYELARAQGRKMVHTATKANIMKMTEGYLKRVAEQVSQEYPDIKSEHIIIDNCCHKLVMSPEKFDVIVSTNMNGDIVSDLTSGLVGGLGLAPSMNIGDDAIMFEAVHGTAPDIAGQDKANPTALLLAAVMMLRHFGMFDTAMAIEHALWVTLEGGTFTGDIALGRPAVGTKKFTETIMSNLGKTSAGLGTREYKPIKMPQVAKAPDLVKAAQRQDVGVDVFIESGLLPDAFGKAVEKATWGCALKLKNVSNRGVQVWPTAASAFDGVDHYGCRFFPAEPKAKVTDKQVTDLLTKLTTAGLRWMHIEKLIEIDGKPGFAKSQGES